MQIGGMLATIPCTFGISIVLVTKFAVPVNRVLRSAHCKSAEALPHEPKVALIYNQTAYLHSLFAPSPYVFHSFFQRLWYLAGVAPVPCQEREAASFLLDSEVLSAQLHPRFNGQCAEALVLLASGQLHVVSLRKEEEGGCSIVSTLTPSPSDVACVSATYDHHGQRIFMGLQPQEGRL